MMSDQDRLHEVITQISEILNDSTSWTDQPTFQEALDFCRDKLALLLPLRDEAVALVEEVTFARDEDDLQLQAYRLVLVNTAGAIDTFTEMEEHYDARVRWDLLLSVADEVVDWDGMPLPMPLPADMYEYFKERRDEADDILMEMMQTAPVQVLDFLKKVPDGVPALNEVNRQIAMLNKLLSVPPGPPLNDPALRQMWVLARAGIWDDLDALAEEDE